jgi:uncharacterized protein (TIGR02145 family)
MKHSTNFLTVAMLFLVSSGCQKIEPEREIAVKTGQPSEVSVLVWSAAGTIVDLGEKGITQHGFCYATHKEPSLIPNDSTINLGTSTSTGEFSGSLKGLIPGTIYYVRAFASDSGEPAYGNEVTFTTRSVEAPAVTTNTMSDITASSARSGGNVMDDGGDSVTARGVCWSTSQNPTTADHLTTDGTGTGTFSSALTGLDPETTYYVRAYASNSAGTGYGSELTFTTLNSVGLPTVSTSSITNVTETSAQGGGEVTDDGGGTVTARGVCWSTSQNPTTADNFTTDGTGTGSFTSVISGLSCELTYYVRAYATNSSGTSYGEEVSFTTNSCPEGMPVVTTATVNSITETTAQSGGDVTDEGLSAVVERGVCWSIEENPSISDYKSADGTGTGNYTSEIMGLTCGTTYYVRAYATNSAGTTYGEEFSFMTLKCPGAPVVTTAAVIGITDISAQSGGTVTDDGGVNVTAKGVCWSTSSNPTLFDNFTSDGAGTGSFTSSMTGLSCGTTYYVKAYATNASGTSYGSQVNFTTGACPPPTVTTSSITDITETTAQGGGNVTSNGGETVIAKGVCWSPSPNPTTSNSKTNDGSGTGSFTSSITGLDCGTTHYVRAYATTSSETYYGEELSFNNSNCTFPPTVTTMEITDVTETSAQGGGNVTDDGGDPVTAKGVCWAKRGQPTIYDNVTVDGSGTGSFTSSITGLIYGTDYYVRAYATNSKGTTYGDQYWFATPWDYTVTDFDGNVYTTIGPGNQRWLAQDLKVTHYADGTPIPMVENVSEWDALSDSDKAYCWYDNNASNGDDYGVLYTWAAAMNGAVSSDANPSHIQGVCPTGWHLPSDSEWKFFETEVLGLSEAAANDDGWRGTDAGGLLKETGITYWDTPNTGATHDYGFHGRGAGMRTSSGVFSEIKQGAWFWTATENDSQKAWTRSLSYDRSSIGRTFLYKNDGFLVRCIKD